MRREGVLENTLYMRGWARCFCDPAIGITMGDFVRRFEQYRRWFEYQSLIAPGRRIRWR